MTTRSGAGKAFIMARTRAKRPTLQHRILASDPNYTQCGIYVRDWPWRTYQKDPIQFLTCMRCSPEAKL